MHVNYLIVVDMQNDFIDGSLGSAMAQAIVPKVVEKAAHFDGKVIFTSWFEGGNVIRSGVAFRRGAGKIFYFSPGHETYPIYHDPNILQVIANAVRWAAPEEILPPRITPMPEPLEPVSTVNPLSGIDPELIHGKR